MPILFGTTIYSATYNTGTLEISCSGIAFGEEIDPISDILTSPKDSNTWTSVTSPPTYWSDSLVTGTCDPALASGTYDVMVVSSDGEEAILEDAFSVGAPTMGPAFKIDIGSNWNYINQTYVKVSGAWAQPTAVFTKLNGEWRYHY